MAEVSAPGVPLLRRGRGWALVAVVSLVHLVAVNELASDAFGWAMQGRQMPRIEVAFVRELQQATPPQVAPSPAPVLARADERVLPLVARRPKNAASATASRSSEASEPPPEPMPPKTAPSPIAAAPGELPASAALPLPLATDLPGATVTDAALAVPPIPGASAPPLAVEPDAASAATAAPVSVASSAAPAFEWPPSTRLSYLLHGDVNGPVDGTAQVEWLRQGQRYQVRFEVSAATFFSRRSVSDGELTARGLEPRQFSGEQRVMFKTRRWSQQFGPDRITSSDGHEQPTAPGVQDEASQFVQLTWLFTTQPQLLRVGRSIEVPLMINRRLDMWVYDVLEQETLSLPFGEVPTFHVKPRRVRPGALAVEMWFAPSLQYLPVRIVIRQNDNNHMDLTLKMPPMQAADTGPR